MTAAQSIMADDRLSGCADLLRKDPAAAAARITAVLKDDPLNASAYRLLAQAKQAQRGEASLTGDVRSSTVSVSQSRLGHAARALQANDLPTAEIILRARLLDEPTDIHALRMMADLGARLGLDDGTEQLLLYILDLEPGFNAATLDLAKQRYLHNRYEEALVLIAEVLARQPDHEGALYMKGVVLGHAGRFDEAIATYQDLVQRLPDRARLWASYGRSLKTVGRSQEGIAAFRRAAEIDPSLGEAWWSLSDLKTVRFDDDDIARMEAGLAKPDLARKDRYYLHFALGKAYETKRDHAQSFAHYAEGNRLHREELEPDADRFTSFVTAAKRTFTRDFFEARSGWGSPVRDPIFILGMTRAGSTLIEQILASHPAIEGTMELPNVLSIAKSLADEFEDRVPAIAALQPDRLVELGERYIRETRSYRKTDRPFFIDKMPNNWLYVPLIHLMLPNARIIDARRHPLACCFSNFKQNYARGQTFSYDLGDLGTYYANYVRMMAHIDDVLPGKIHRLFHENMVDDTEGEIRRLLDYLGLPFDDNCLRFHENARAVRTASAEQVRRPINREGVDQWRDYEPWLGQLKEALGPVLTSYPDVPSFSE